MNKCFVWKTNDQYSTPSFIYNYFINYLHYVDFNPLCVDYEDSLKKEFNCDLFCNPPYSNIEPFVDYMLDHMNKGFSCIMLLPVRSGTKWFKKIIDNKLTINFFTQRLNFNDGKYAPFDCMLVVFDNFYKNKDLKINFINRKLEGF